MLMALTDAMPAVARVKMMRLCEVATVVSHGRHDKVHIFKMRRRKHYQRHGGHRQNYTEIQIGTISA